MIEHYVADLQSVSEAIQNQDGERLLDIFSRAKAARDRYIDRQGRPG